MREHGFPAGASALAGVAAIALAVMPDTAAAAPGAYMAGTVGQSSADLHSTSNIRLNSQMVNAWSTTHDISMITWTDTQLDRGDRGFEIALGYQFSPHLALEGAYINLGDITYRAPISVGATFDEMSEATSTVQAGRAGPALSMVGSWPLGSRFSVDARAGTFFGKSTAKVTYALVGEGPSHAQSSRRETRLLLGAGVNWSVSPKTDLRLGYTRFGRDALIHHDTARISLGVKVAF